jgi:hypothetical protein
VIALIREDGRGRAQNQRELVIVGAARLGHAHSPRFAQIRWTEFDGLADCGIYGVITINHPCERLGAETSSRGLTVDLW